jgi:hypothetical protein
MKLFTAYLFIPRNVFRLTKTSQRPEHLMQAFQDFTTMSKHVDEATWHIFIPVAITDQI